MLCFFLLNWETCSQKYSTSRFRLIFNPGLIFYLEQLTIWDITIVVHIVDPKKGSNVKNQHFQLISETLAAHLNANLSLLSISPLALKWNIHSRKIFKDESKSQTWNGKGPWWTL